MVEPEIARRCTSCGASVRQRAAFCPQCGQLLGQKQPESQSDPQTNAVEGLQTQIIAPPSEGLETQIIAAPSEAPETQILAAPSEAPETQIIAAPYEGPETQIIVAPSEVPPIASELSDASAMTQTDLVLPEELRSDPAPIVAATQPLIRHTIQREPTVSEADIIDPHAPDGVRPGVEHNLMDRVDRIRKVSSVVIDQAAYVPSLRFLLVAAVLFILFVVLMVVSKVIG
ncbi:MAG TPA: zinc ribbon domain-containing protein [Pyrinomonadaceae bacterium]